MKRLTLLVLLSAFMALPTLANAEVVVTNGSGEPASEVQGVSENFVISFSGSAVKCATWTTTETVTQNSFWTYHAHVTGTGEHEFGTWPHANTCRLTSGNLPTHVVSYAGTKHWSLINPFTYAQTGTADIVITHPVLGEIQCTMKETSTASYVSGSDSVSISGTFTGTKNIPPCPASGSVSGNFTYTDEFGEPVVIH